MLWAARITALVAAVAGLIGSAGFASLVALQGRHLPDQPLHTRLNPFNHLARPDTWTPAMRAANRRAVICGIVALGGVLAFCVLATLGG